MNFLKEKAKGILLTFFIALLAIYISQFIENLGGVTLAIILGLIIGNVFKISKDYSSGIKFVEKKVLALAIMLMGLKLEINVLKELGLSSIIMIITMVAITILTGLIVGKLFGLNKKFSLLIGVGNAICGSSAIAASAPVIGNTEEEIGLSISVVNLLGTIGIFLLPFITTLLGFDNTNSGLMIGSTLQATGQVVAAGFSINELVGKVATIVKMGRILTLGPVVILLSFLYFRQKDNSIKTKSKIKIPPFIIGFLIFSIISSLKIMPDYFISTLKNFSSILLTIAMAAIGLKIKISTLFDQGPKALLVGITIVIIQITTATLLIFLI